MTITRTLTAATWCTTAVLASALVVSTYAPLLHPTATPPSYSPAVQACIDQHPDGACTDRPFIATAPASQATLGPCATEDSAQCYFNGYTMGNGEGRSYLYLDHVVYYTDGTVEFPECTDDGDYCADSLGY